MKSQLILPALLFLLFPFVGIAQTSLCDCRADLAVLDKKLKKTPAFRQNKESYKTTYTKVLQEFENQALNQNYLACFRAVNRILLSLNDWHMKVIESGEKDPESITVEYPYYRGDLDALQKQLEGKSQDEIEGIYHRKGRYSFGLVRQENGSGYNAVLLKTDSKDWQPGQIFLQLEAANSETFTVTGAQFPRTRAISYLDRIKKGVFLLANFRKDTIRENFYNSPFPEETYMYKELSPTIDYLKVGSFKSFYPTLKEAEDFYKSIQGKLNKPHTILDLRNNGGGGDRNSDLLMVQLKEYLKNGQLHVITNTTTGSNAEQFAVKLKKMKNVTTYGVPSKGAISYELKGKITHTLPSTGFIVILTSRAHKEFLPFETKGISPNYPLDLDKSWLDQIVSLVNNAP